MNINLALIYYSATGTVYHLAREAERAAREAGAEVRLRKVRELAPDEAIASNPAWVKHRDETRNVPEAAIEDLLWADALMFGTPTRYGLPTAQLKQFIDQTGGIWAEGKLVNKTATSFTSTATTHGGHETTLVALNNTFYHWGCVLVPPGYAAEIQMKSGTPYGATHVARDGSPPPGDVELAAIRFQAQRLVEITRGLKVGMQRELAGVR